MFKTLRLNLLLSGSNRQDAGNVGNVPLRKYAFPLAGKDQYSPEELSHLLERALLDGREDLREHKKHYIDEWAADLGTFITTIFSFSLEAFLESIGAGAVIGYLGREKKYAKEDLKAILDVWSELDSALNDENFEDATAFRRAEEKMRHMGLLFEALDEKADWHDFEPEEFRRLALKYSGSFSERAKAYVTQTPLQHYESAKKAWPRQFDNAWRFTKIFVKGLGQNLQEPGKFRTPKAVLNGFLSICRIAGSWAIHKKQGFHPLHEDNHVLQNADTASPEELEVWNKSLEIEAAVQKEFRETLYLAPAFAGAVVFMAYHGVELSHKFHQAAEGNVSPAVIGVFSMVAGAGPLKKLGEKLETAWEEISSLRVKSAENYILGHEIKKNRTLERGL